MGSRGSAQWGPRQGQGHECVITPHCLVYRGANRRFRCKRSYRSAAAAMLVADQALPSRTMAFRMIDILRTQATRADIRECPASSNRPRYCRVFSFDRDAETDAMKRARRTQRRPPRTDLRLSVGAGGPGGSRKLPRAERPGGTPALGRVGRVHGLCRLAWFSEQSLRRPYICARPM